jgi:hypothetical protein
VAPDAFVMTVMLPHHGHRIGRGTRESFATTPMVALTSSLLMRELAEESGLFTAVLDRPPISPSCLRCCSNTAGKASKGRRNAVRTPIDGRPYCASSNGTMITRATGRCGPACRLAPRSRGIGRRCTGRSHNRACRRSWFRRATGIAAATIDTTPGRVVDKITTAEKL